MNKQHFGAVAAVLAGYVFCRVLAYHVVSVLAAIGGHRRPGDYVIGSLFGAIPFVALGVYSLLVLRHLDLGRRWVSVLGAAGWLFAGGVMGLLPYSRFGLEVHLIEKERASAPGFLHALDVTIFVGLLLTVGLLLVALRAHPTERTVR